MSYTFNKKITDYSEGIQKLIRDIEKEAKNGVKDGLIFRMASQAGGEAQVYDFLKREGYDINYKDYIEFYNDMEEVVKENEDLLEKSVEEIEMELSEDDLEGVAGGASFWKRHALDFAMIAGGGIAIGVSAAFFPGSTVAVAAFVSPIMIDAAKSIGDDMLDGGTQPA